MVSDMINNPVKQLPIINLTSRQTEREQYLTPTYKLMLKFQTLDSFLNEQLRISKRNYRQSQANITVAGIIQSEGKE